MGRNDPKLEGWQKVVMDNKTRELKIGEFRCGYCGYVMSSGDYSCGGCGRGMMFIGTLRIADNRQSAPTPYHNTTENKTAEIETQRTTQDRR